MSKDIVIFENPQKGMSQHPSLGVGLLRCIDTESYPGVARLNKTVSKLSTAILTGVPYWIVRNPANGDLYALDSGGQVTKSTTDGATWAVVSGNTLTGGTGQGLAIWKGFLIVARATQLDAYNLATPGWTNGFLDTEMDATQDFHFMLPSLDDNLYITCGRYIYKLKENTTFDPTSAQSSSTNYSETQRAITLPTNYNAKTLADLGSSLMIGTWFGSSNSSYLEHKVADIFPYNRVSLTLGIPVRLGENGVHQMITVGNRLYAIAGINGKIFLTDGSSAIQVSEIPNYAVNLLDTGYRLEFDPGAICYHRGKILFGVHNSGAVNGNCGVWAFNPATRLLSLENIVSTGNDGTAELEIGSLFSISNEAFIIGWRDYTTSVTSGIDLKSASSFITTYGGIIETPFVQVGTATGNRTIQSVEFYLAKPLRTGEGIRIKYRKDLTTAFSTLATYDYTTNGAIQTASIPGASITNAIFVQFRIELTSNASTSPELVRVLLKPSN